MDNIREVSFQNLAEVVDFINLHWNEISKRPSASSEERELSFWEQIHRHNRVLTYLEDNGSIIALLTLTKQDKTTEIGHFYVIPEVRDRGIGAKMLYVAEKFAVNWKSEKVLFKMSGREEVEKFFPYFQRQGYALHCPMNEPDCVTLEKVMREHQ